MSLNIKIKDGDLQFDSLGQLVFVNKTDSIIQNIQHRLNTYKGDLFYDYNYGITRDLDRSKLKQEKMHQLQSIISEAMSYDITIQSISITKIDKIGFDTFNVNLKVLLTDDAIIDMDYLL